MRRIFSAALSAGLVLSVSLIVSTPAAQAAAREVTGTCANVVVIGARGSGENVTIPGYRKNFGKRTHKVAEAIGAGLPAGTTVKYEGLDYPAVKFDFFTVFLSDGKGKTQMLNSVAAGRDALRKRINYYASACPASRLALVGYSQGSWVIHEALATYGRNYSQTAHVRAVVLLADPANNGSKYNTVMVNNSGVATGESVSKVEGSQFVAGNWNPTLQDWSRTISFCGNRDLVCSIGRLSAADKFKSHGYAYDTKNVVSLASRYALARLAPKNNNGVCDAGEFCAYKDAGYKNIVLDINVPSGYKRIDVPDDAVSSVWNRTAFTWYGRNQRRGLPDATVLTVGAGKSISAPTSAWNDKIDHFNAG